MEYFMARSIEELIEDWAKGQLKEVKYYTKTESINTEIEKALKTAPSKSGGAGANIPDIKLLIETKDLRYIPVMIEVKGKKGAFIKLDKAGNIDNYSKNNTLNHNNIEKYAVNGALHYAKAIVDYSNYKNVLAIGINGYDNGAGDITKEIGVYYISEKNMNIAKKVDEYTDLSFLLPKYRDKFIEKIDKIVLTDKELEQEALKIEDKIENSLTGLNQIMHDEYKIDEKDRVILIISMIMAGLGIANEISPLRSEDLKSEKSGNNNDGEIIYRKIKDFLEYKNLVDEKKNTILDILRPVITGNNLSTPEKTGDASRLKKIYMEVESSILPLFKSNHHLDYTGKLFNVLNRWVKVPDKAENDVVLTPRYVTEMMVSLCQVNMDSYVWDYAAGSGGFLISAMKHMIKDAEERIKSPDELNKKILHIKCNQLLGIEILKDIYLLAVLNMILMGDGSSHILHKDSLKEYDGKYEQGENKDKDFPADVFLLNPPYSKPGKGFIFVEKALSKMKTGKAAVLIQENAGSGNAVEYTKKILENNTLLASIHMADIFRGKASVQTAVYLFDVGKPHKEENIVRFIDFSNDGYTRQNRKKSGLEVNLKNTSNADERYKEVVQVALYGKSKLHYLKMSDYIEDTITLKGDDWTFSQHRKIDTNPTIDDFKQTVKDYLAWKVSTIIQQEETVGKQ